MSDHDFELRLQRALRADAERAVRPFDAVELATSAAAAGRTARRPLDWLSAGWPAIRLVLIASLLLLAAAGTLWLVAVGAPARPSLVVAPPSAAPSAPPAVASSGATAVDEVLRSRWTADADPIPALGVAGPRIGLMVHETGSSAWIIPSDSQSRAATSTLRSTGASELTVSLDRDVTGCASGDLGRYQWSETSDHLLLTLTAIEDPCAPRRDAMERTWTRSHMALGTGGAGVIDVFDPPVQITLPLASWSAQSYPDVAALSSPDLGVFAFRDPQGFTKPCTSTGGARRDVAHGLDAFEAYIRDLPGYTVTATDETVGGFPARHFDITTVPTVDCPRGTPIVGIQAKADSGGMHWVLGAGDPDSMDIVELPERMVLLQLVPQNTAPFDGRPILDSVRFLDATTPAASPAP